MLELDLQFSQVRVSRQLDLDSGKNQSLANCDHSFNNLKYVHGKLILGEFLRSSNLMVLPCHINSLGIPRV